MEISKNNQTYLDMMKDLFAVSEELGTRTYIWGGFAVDIIHGDFLREHSDLDGFILNLLSVKDEFSSKLIERGYEVSFNMTFHILRMEKGDLHAGFNALELDHEIAMWRHIGDRGTVYFPKEWLDDAPRIFHVVPVFTSGIRFEYGFRTIAHLLNPEWKEREKDAAAKAFFREQLSISGIEPESVLSSIWSYNPLWLRKGYDPFRPPVLVVPGAGGKGE